MTCVRFNVVRTLVTKNNIYIHIMATIIDEGNPDDFIKYMFDKEPKPLDTIQLECPDIDEGKNTHLHIFEQLLMIYVGGLKHKWSDEAGKVDLTKLTEENISLMKRYFESINYIVNIEVFDLSTYQFKFPDYFKNQEHVTDKTLLPDFFYETQGNDTKMYRISFNFL
jgi:hypothetical protein